MRFRYTIPKARARKGFAGYQQRNKELADVEKMHQQNFDTLAR